jgi:DNA-binding transcriptional MocR family regulator
VSIWIPEIKNTDVPRYRAIVDELEQAIQAKQVFPGQRLPTHRELAYQLGISVQTVARAYAEAERRGLTTGEIGRGTFVQFIATDQGQGFIADRKQAGAIDLSNVLPIVSELHVKALKQAITELAGTAAMRRVLEYRPTQGTAPHRQAGVTWLERNGVPVDVENVIVTNGAAHGIWTAMASIVEPGDVVATEALVDTSIITNAAILKLRLRGVPIDEQGIIPEALEEAHRRDPIKLLCVTPCYSNPTVSLMGEERRSQIADVARRHDISIIEDDVFGPLIPNRPKPIWSFAPERTYYVTSFSKALAASLRTGYLVGPLRMVPRLVSRLRTTGWMANTWTAEIVAAWLYDGTADKLIDWQRRKLQARHKQLLKILGKFELSAQPYAMHAWLTLPEQWRSQRFVEQARTRGVLVTPPDPFIVGRAADPHAIRLALGDTNRDDQDFLQGLERIASLLTEEPEPSSSEY